MIAPAIYSSERTTWRTPMNLFAQLDQEFGFTLDAAASRDNALCQRFITEEQDALTCDWHELAKGGAVWRNPPYGRGVGKWVRKAWLESAKGTVVVMLIPARTDTAYFREWAMQAAEIRLIAGRLRFQGADNPAPFPSALLVFSRIEHRPRISVYEVKDDQAKD